MKNEVFKVLLLQALPASGKSEVRNMMANVEPEVLKKEFHVGENLQLDDFPYVFMMRRIDEELVKLNKEPIFYSKEGPFIDGRDWGTLSCLLNEDYYDLINQNQLNCKSYGYYYLRRIDTNAKKVGLEERLAKLDEETFNKIAMNINAEAKNIQLEKEQQYTSDLNGKTIIIENSRGGKDGSLMPLTGTFGYQYSLKNYCHEILDNAAILYIWVTPEESRRKNEGRYDPNDPGSSMNHMVPLTVMLNDYGCDDMIYLKDTSEKENTVTIEKDGKKYFVPIGVIDNRIDKTTFLRNDPQSWDKDLLQIITDETKNACQIMWKNYNKKQ